MVSLFAPGMEQSWRHTCLLINAPLCRRAAWQATVSNPGRGLGILGRHHGNIKTVALSVYLSASTLFVQINIGRTRTQPNRWHPYPARVAKDGPDMHPGWPPVENFASTCNIFYGYCIYCNSYLDGGCWLCSKGFRSLIMTMSMMIYTSSVHMASVVMLLGNQGYFTTQTWLFQGNSTQRF